MIRRLIPPTRGIFLTACCIVALGRFSAAQVSTSISSLTPTEISANLLLSLRAQLTQWKLIENAYFVYRTFGESQWTKLEMALVGNTAFVEIPPARVVPPFIEYYIVLVHRSGLAETYPISESADPISNPPSRTERIVVHPAEQESQVVFLSPEPGSRVASEDFLLSVSLFRADTVVVKRATQIWLDGTNVTNEAMFSGDIIVFVPENLGERLQPGGHNIKVLLFDREGYLHHSAEMNFTIHGAGVQPAPAEQFTYNGDLSIESRREKVATTAMWYNRGNLQFTGRMRDWRFKTNLYITSDEQSNRQPQNRYYAAAESPWLRVGYGDSYPSFPNLVLSGKRVRGLNAGLKLNTFNLDIALGKTTRGIEGKLLKVIPLSDLATEQMKEPGGSYAQIDSVTWGKFTYGTYERDLFAIRPSFGSGETWQLGFTWLKSKDDVSSIQYGIRPQENLVVGSDLVARFDNNRIEFSAQGAFSAYNADISSGNFTDAYIDTVYKKNADAVKSARDILQNFITVNDNLRPLSFKKLSTLAYETALGLHYVNNAFRFTYLFRGSDYNSFGQTFLRTDIRGFNVVDRIQLVNNQVLLSLGYEHLSDNTSDTKGATTDFNNVNIAVSYYARSNAPNVTVGYARFDNDNDIRVNGPDSSIAINDVTNRFFLQSSYRFDFKAQHTVSLNLSTSNRNDETVRNFDVKNLTVALSLLTRYTIPLETNVELGFNTNTIPSIAGTQKLDYSTLSVFSRYSFLEHVLSVSAGMRSSFGDFTRTSLDLQTEWFITKGMNFTLQYSYFANKGLPSDDFLSLRYRYDI